MRIIGGGAASEACAADRCSNVTNGISVLCMQRFLGEDFEWNAGCFGVGWRVSGDWDVPIEGEESLGKWEWGRVLGEWRLRGRLRVRKVGCRGGNLESGEAIGSSQREIERDGNSGVHVAICEAGRCCRKA